MKNKLLKFFNLKITVWHFLIWLIILAIFGGIWADALAFFSAVLMSIYLMISIALKNKGLI